jgi:hypothetical protein
MSEITGNRNKTHRGRGRRPYRAASCLLIFALLLAGCKIPAPAETQPTHADPQALFTAAAQTAEATRPVSSPDAPTSTIPVPPGVAPTPTPTGPVIATVLLPTADTSSAEGDQAEFVDDPTVPDGTEFKPNEPFIKTWRLRNTGANTWSTDYALVFTGGELMGGPPAVPIPREVLPGETIDISVNLIAPPEPSPSGTYQGLWKLRNAGGQIFGVGPDGGNPFWVIITVSGVPADATGTPVSGGSIVSAATLTLEEPEFSGACPHTFKFTLELNLAQPATVTYVLEAGAQDGIELKLPPPATSNLDAGVHQFIYELSFAQSLNGWARLHVTSPETIYSNQVNFSLPCQ